MRLMRPPGVYAPQGDTFLLVEVLRKAPLLKGARVLDVCTGTGALALAAARAGAGRVTAVDVSTRAVLAARANARLNRLPIRVLQGDLFGPVAGQAFDMIVTNPPYVPSGAAAPGRAARWWNGGPDGRALLDRICERAPRQLRRGGTLLIVQSAVSGVQATLDALRAQGMTASVAARRTQPYGPVLRARAAELEAAGLARPGGRSEELVVVRADRN
ncbi:HemK2/MTQ2 family protein methyltransferase [Spirillospora sp. NPDC046719]|uniref:HemK2/MTQ2 family protein methyltransferase n=2 Tax=Actinomadura TaxID=1988 RepID=UPI0016878C45|nr:HemK2/MTQ2 family protein methyltransferase [Actinomadura sp. RB99]